MHPAFRHRPGRVALAFTIAFAAVFLIVAYRSSTRGPSPSKPSAAKSQSIASANSVSAAKPINAAPASAGTAPLAVAKPSRNAATSTMPQGAAGMVVGIDPETGRLGLPSRADRDALQRQAAAQSPAIDHTDAPPIIHRPDGSMKVDLMGRFQEYAIVKITPDGQKVQDCVQEGDVKDALAKPAPRLEER